MADEKPSGSGLGGSGLVLFIAALASAAYVGFHPPPLVSSRPSEADSQIHDAAGAQDIDARLWQDPFAAITQIAASDRLDSVDVGERHSFPALDTIIQDGGKPLQEDGKSLVMAVALPGARYPVAAETRRRLRYSVLAALEAEHYTPYDEKHLGYVQTDEAEPLGGEVVDSNEYVLNGRANGFSDSLSVDHRIRQEKNGPQRGAALLPKLIPFETFDRDFAADPLPTHGWRPERVVLLWLDEDILAAGRQPIGSVKELLCRLKMPQRARFALLGPQDSSTLIAMLNETGQNTKSVFLECAAQPNGRGSNSSTKIDRLRMFNFGASADEGVLLKHKNSLFLKNSSSSIDEILQSKGIEYLKTIASDKVLADALVCELGRRGMKWENSTAQCSDQNHGPASAAPGPVALVYEADTVYGRSLRDVMVSRFGPENVKSYSYLRGLDGRVSGRHSSNGEARSSKAGKDTQNDRDERVATPDTAGDFEAAEGESQFDYLRRLATLIRDRDEKLRGEGGPGIAAVGLLGNDVYDKLLILQALRPELPEAQFFTTDLDALLLPQEKSRYTRNLLVASSYGLTLDPVVQHEAPPFRSTYQTSIFMAVRLAVRLNEAAPTEAACELHQWLTPALLFQIGRTTAQALPFGPNKPSFVPCVNRSPQDRSILRYISIQPNPGELYPKLGEFVKFGIFFFPTVFLSIFLLKNVRKVVCHKTVEIGKVEVPARPSRFWLLLLAPAVVLWAWLILDWPRSAGWLTENGAGDPMTLFEGISVWPTVALRVLGIFLSVFLAWYTLRSLAINRLETMGEMRISVKAPPTVRETFAFVRQDLHERGNWWSTLRQLFWLFPKIPAPAPGDRRPKLDFQSIAGEPYSSTSQIRCIRASFYTAVMMLVIWSWILVPIFGSPDYFPGRGTLSHNIYRAATIAEVVATLFLTFLVVDATLYSRSFIKRLTDVRTDWPNETIACFNRFKIRSADLGDWLDIRYLARRTSCITQLIYFPFVSVALMIGARSRVFDNFSTPWTLPIAQAICLAVIVGSVLAYQIAAEKARLAAHEELTAKIIAAQGVDDRRASQLRLILTEIENLKDGAFAPITSQPVVKAVLLPLLSYGGMMLAHLYALPGT